MRRACPDAASSGAAAEVEYQRVRSLVVGPAFLACGPAGRISCALPSAAIPLACIVKRDFRSGHVPPRTLPSRKSRFPCLRTDLPRSRHAVGRFSSSGFFVSNGRFSLYPTTVFRRGGLCGHDVRTYEFCCRARRIGVFERNVLLYVSIKNDEPTKPGGKRRISSTGCPR